ncbi:2'-5' RNA ligase family protein [Flavobacterium foetidum]|uniref:2'-5' RNA ligase family protein n=1 Tax=Flavobacterium foetidum TaxID=2026681 RepID=UPI0010757395|nr:mutarotase [Flavobacterium foetidum]KAF2517033.1 mutarotase [Flavobacterium foetidum]
MNLKEHYNQLYQESSKAILNNNYSIDHQIKNTADSRFGITLLLRPNEKIKSATQLFLNELRQIEPNQYYYPNSDIHSTVMSIISCYNGFTLDKINIEDYITVIQESLINLDKIKIRFQGITASSSAIMLQGFPSDESLHRLRNKLRYNFKKTNLEQSIDSRYAILTAHATVMRFQEKLQNPSKLIETVEKFRNFDFGEFTAENLELVFNDWYQRAEKTIHLKNFRL